MLERLASALTAYRRTRIYQKWDYERGLNGKPDVSVVLPLTYAADRLRWGQLGYYIWQSRRVPSWTRDREAVRLAHEAFALDHDAVIVEIGSFLGCSAILLAGARKLRGSGMVHCVDPFDASGDDFSADVYRRTQSSNPKPLRARFDRNIQRAGVGDHVQVHAVTAEQAVTGWRLPIDLLFLDGNQSYQIVTSVYDAWIPFLKAGGTLVVHNSRPGYRQPSHDGSSRLVEERIHAPAYVRVECVKTMTFAMKTGHGT